VATQPETVRGIPVGVTEELVITAVKTVTEFSWISVCCDIGVTAAVTVVTTLWNVVESVAFIVKEGVKLGAYTATKFPVTIVKLLENTNVRLFATYVTEAGVL
jgi:hypothetical protein